MGNMRGPKALSLKVTWRMAIRSFLGPSSSLFPDEGQILQQAHLPHICSISTEEGSSFSLNFTLWHVTASK